MLYLIPAPLHRAGLRFAHRVRKHWWRLARPQLSGVTLIARDGEGRILLVRHSYGGRHWALPGGGIGKGENPEDAAVREFTEELDCAIYDLVLANVQESTLHGAPCTRHVFVGEVVDIPRPDRREIVEIGFFAPGELPTDCSAMIGACLASLEQR